MNSHLISVITVVYNACNTLDSTIQSVLKQDNNLFEYWIIDGGSTDGSIDIIRKYQHQLAGWLSEPDNGIYDAMNKGVDRANGKWIYFLGGDDRLRPGILKEIQPYLRINLSLLFGDIMYDNGNRYRSFISLRTILQNTIHHQSAFYNASLFKNYRYNTSMKIVSEYDVHLRIFMQRYPVHYIPLVIADCATGGASDNLNLSLIETNRIRGMHLKEEWKNKIFSILLGLYYTQKEIRQMLYGHKIQ